LKIRKPAEVHRNRLTLCPTRYATGLRHTEFDKETRCSRRGTLQFRKQTECRRDDQPCSSPSRRGNSRIRRPIAIGQAAQNLEGFLATCLLPASCVSDGANLDDGVLAGSPIELGYRRAVAAHFAPSID